MWELIKLTLYLFNDAASTSFFVYCPNSWWHLQDKLHRWWKDLFVLCFRVLSQRDVTKEIKVACFGSNCEVALRHQMSQSRSWYSCFAFGWNLVQVMEQIWSRHWLYIRFFQANVMTMSQTATSASFNVVSDCYLLTLYLLTWRTWWAPNNDRGHAVALRYKPEGRGIDFRCCHWSFSLT
jgi:hypothetical protein